MILLILVTDEIHEDLKSPTFLIFSEFSRTYQYDDIYNFIRGGVTRYTVL